MKRFWLFGCALLLALLAVCLSGCEVEEEQNTTGQVRRASVKVETDAEGLTVEQKNIARRLVEDNKPGAIKHLYLISPVTGDVLLYSPVKGKVTSSGKRLKPKEEASSFYNGASYDMFTREVIGDDGAYGSSNEYLYWWDVFDKYHQVAPNGAIVLISNQPLRTKKAVINLAHEK